MTIDTYNPDGSLATETTGYGTSAAATTSYCYDPAGDTTAVVMPDGNTSGTAPCETSAPWVVSASSYPTQASYQTTYSYDSAGEQVATTRPATSAAPSGATTTSTYDPAGNVLTSTDPNNVTTTWTYTPLNKAATVTYSGGTAHAVSYGYDANGNRTSMSDATGNSSYTYDPFGELTSCTTTAAGQTVSYGYDSDGNETGITYPLPGSHSWAATTTVSYGYDNADICTSVTDFNNHQIAITPNADGLPATVSLGATGDTINTTYDNTDTPSVDHAEERELHAAVVHLFGRAVGQHPERDRHPDLLPVAGGIHLRRQGPGHLHDPRHRIPPELRFRPLIQPDRATDWRQHEL